MLARQLVDADARVAICARDTAELEAAERELQARGGDVLELRCDVNRSEDVRYTVERVRERFGGADVLLNVAGVIQVGPLEAMTREDSPRRARGARPDQLGAMRVALRLNLSGRDREHGDGLQRASAASRRQS